VYTLITNIGQGIAQWVGYRFLSICYCYRVITKCMFS